MESSEIAEDFKDALLDLKVNSKPEIDTLTVIAKENTAYAQAISSVLETHIKTTRPEWMLPALYVLDSLIRHVGPPYSTYLGANLFRTFMDMYRQVNNAVRKDMEAVLRTWKEPPHGSRTTRPVMPIEVTEPIETALSRFRIVTMQSQQPRHMAGQQPFRNSPQPGMMYHNGVGVQGTPPPIDVAALMSQLQQPRTATPTYPIVNGSGMQGLHAISSPALNPAVLAHTFPSSHNNTPTNFQPFSTPSTAHNRPQSSVSQAQLKTEVNQLLQSANVQKLFDASNKDLPQLVNTLESLKGLLDVRQFKEIDLLAMQGELSKISSRLNSQIASLLNKPQGSTPTPMSFVPQMPVNPYPVVATPPSVMPFMPPAIPYPQSQTPQFHTNTPAVAPTPPVDMAALLGLLGPPSAPPPAPPTPGLTGLRPQSMSRDNSHTAYSQAPAANNPLLDMLRASGLLNASASPPPTNHGPSAIMTPNPNSHVKGKFYGVRLDQESITKTRRLHLISALYQDIPDQCRQCGRRFPSTEEGKKQKMNHLDWHFKINSRVANASQSSIVHRSAYLDEIQWTRLRETQDGTDYADESEIVNAKAAANSLEAENEVYVLPPQDATKLNEPCSICMEPFKSVWHLKTQQPVWMDTVKVGNKYYHASCYNEATAGRGPVGRNGAKTSNRSTPDPILGKRKFANVVA